MAVLWPVQK